MYSKVENCSLENGLKYFLSFHTKFPFLEMESAMKTDRQYMLLL